MTNDDYLLFLVAVNETSPTISLKSKLGVNFMVSFGRKEEETSENPLAKLLQATQDVIDKESHADTSNASENNTSISNKISEDIEQNSAMKNKKDLGQSLAAAGNINAIPPPYPPPPVAFMSGPLVAQAAMLSAHPLYGPEPEEESCGRPFCKLKRRAHYHCNLCNQGFTEKDKLETHLKRHTEPPQNAMPGAISNTPSLASLLAAAKESGVGPSIPNIANTLLNSGERDSSNSISNLLASTEQALKHQQAVLSAATSSENRRNSSPNRAEGSPLTSSIANLSVLSQRPQSPGSRSGHSASPSPSLGGNSMAGSNNGAPTSSSIPSSISVGKPSESPRPSSAGSGNSSPYPTSSMPSVSNSAVAAAAASMFPGLGASVSAASLFNLRHPAFTSAGGIAMPPVSGNGAAGMLLPPGLNPFFPPGFLQLPGMPSHNPFQPMMPGVPGDLTRLPTSTVTPGVSGMVFDPTKHPLTRMPGDPSLSSLKRAAASPMSSILLDDDSTLTPEEKKFKLQSSMRMLKDEPVPEGYMRFRYENHVTSLFKSFVQMPYHLIYPKL